MVGQSGTVVQSGLNTPIGAKEKQSVALPPLEFQGPPSVPWGYITWGAQNLRH